MGLNPSKPDEGMRVKGMNLILLAGVLVSFPALVFGEQDVQVEIYNPQNESIFPTTSVLVSSCGQFEPELILFDGQFNTKDGDNLLEMIRATGKPLKQIVITCGDPDYYFGLQPIMEAYPDVQILSSARTAERIRQSKDAKLEYWSPALKESAPTKLYEPQITDQTSLTIANETIELRSSDLYAAYVWIPGPKVILGGVGVFWNMHVFVADAQTKEKRESWRDVLREMVELEPEVVIPGHFSGKMPKCGDEAVRFTLKYLEIFEKALEENDYKNSTAVIDAMKNAYPELGYESILELSAKVNTGEQSFGK